MKKFNNQFATQRLLQEQQGPFYVLYNKGYGQGKGVANDFKPFPSFEAAQAFADERNNLASGTFSKFQKYYYVIGSDHEDFEWVSQAAHDKVDALRIHEVKFTIDDSDLYSAVMDRYMRDTRMPITDEGDYLETDEATFQGIQAIALDLDKVDALRRYDDLEEEGSVTSGGEAYLPGLDVPEEKYKKEAKDKEPKLAAGKAKVYMKDKWGWKEAPSIPNRPSKGGFIYKQLFEALNEDQDIPENIVKFAKRKGISSQLNTIAGWVKKAGKRIVGGTAIGKDYNTLVLDLTHQGSEIYYNIEKDTIDVKGYDVENEEEFLAALQKDDSELNENYSRFKKETKTRTSEQQLHAAMKLAERKIHEANRILEYTAQLRTELTETKVNKNTQKLMEKVTRGIAEAYGKMKKLK